MRSGDDTAQFMVLYGKLRQEYADAHEGTAPNPLPEEWVNARLEELGESRQVRNTPKGFELGPPFSKPDTTGFMALYGTLRQEYAAAHGGVVPNPLPEKWVNKRLEELGDARRVQNTPNGLKLSQRLSNR